MTAELGVALIAFVAAVCLLSGFAHGALGFGFPIVATPIVALAIDLKSAIALLAPITLVLTVISALRGVALMSIVREFWFLPLAVALGAWLGTRILLAMPPEPFVLVLVAVILLYLNLDRLGRGKSVVVQRLRVPSAWHSASWPGFRRPSPTSPGRCCSSTSCCSAWVPRRSCRP